jgi:sugar lactone lactonase YvrE
MLNDGTLLIAEQQTNRILALAPGKMSPSVLRTLPGIPTTAQCKDGVDGIALDPTNNTLIVPDSPTGNVYRMSLDGRKLSLLTSGITRPVGAAVDAQGTAYITDECGGALWRVPQGSKAERIGNFGMLDDVVVDTHGNAFVTDLKINIHALIKINLMTGKRQILAQRGFIEPQGLAIDGQGNLYLSDDYANVIVKYTLA